MEPPAGDAPLPSSSVIFLGTGCSTVVPDTRCLVTPSAPPCPVCSQSLSLPPDQNPNYRCNNSLLIDYCNDDGAHKYIIIDVGKTFREQVLRWFVHRKIPWINSIILTHDHADAILGLDDIWIIQPSDYKSDFGKFPVYLTQFTMGRIIEGDTDKPFVSSGLEFVPLPVRAIVASYLGGKQKLHIYPTSRDFYLKLSMLMPSFLAAISKSGAGQLDLLILEANSLHGEPPAGDNASPPSSSVIFLGTGCSAALPDTRCLIRPSATPCPVCSLGISLPPEQNPNYRCNTSLLIDYCDDDGTHKYIIIDVGKTFREQVLRWFVHHKIPWVDSVLTTFGWFNQRVAAMMSANVASRFPYLVKHKVDEGDEISQVAHLDWRIIEDDIDKPFVSSGLEFVPLPVMHGVGYVCLGFLFGRKARVAYLSDVSRFLPETEYAISKSGGGQLDLLILEANTLHGETLDAVKRISPKRALLIGMRHEFEHYTENKNLAKWSSREGIPVELAHDGLRVFIDL
uniref:Metallo-beta-lactamase domain-containing protein n=1 Tax=Leersia perrieri TaxID=77586 RepID=A0A0D9VWS7_9ORYZ